MKPMRTMVHCEEGPLVAPAIRTSPTLPRPMEMPCESGEDAVWMAATSGGMENFSARGRR